MLADGSVSRLVGVAALVGLAVGLSVPVMAGHVVEPTAPITDLDISLYEYGTRNRAVCGDTFDFDRVYIDIFVTASAAPSEHFDVRRAWAHRDQVTEDNGDWLDWEHQNVPPHPHNQNPRWKMTKGEFPAPMSGPLSVLVEVTGQESGVVLTETCTIYRG